MRAIDAIDHIRSHRELYLPGGEPDPVFLANRLAGDAMILGAKRVELLHEDDWWAVTADVDWLRSPQGPDVREMFSRIVPFPEAGVNSMRSEVLLSAFARHVVTATAEGSDVVQGEIPAARQIWCGHPSRDWKRIVAFRL